LTEAYRFWEEKALSELTPDEWEALCDGCGKCCLHKIEDMDTGEVYYTNVACRLLDLTTCRCLDYANRSSLVPDCLRLTADLAHELAWLPESCAYRRLAEGRPLAWWHPLNSGDPKTVRQVGVSICGKAVAEKDVDLEDLEDMVVDWFD
jgi:hypothetical protein